MRRLLTFLTLAVLATPVAYGQNGNNNGARVGKAGFLLNVSAFEKCPRGGFAGSHRRSIAVQADYTGVATDNASKVNKVFLRSGADFRGARRQRLRPNRRVLRAARHRGQLRELQQPDVSRAPTFTRIRGARARARQAARQGRTITSCVEMLEIDALTQAEIATSLCSVGATEHLGRDA